MTSEASPKAGKKGGKRGERKRMRSRYFSGPHCMTTKPERKPREGWQLMQLAMPVKAEGEKEGKKKGRRRKR